MMTTSDPEKSSTQSPEGDQSRKRRPSTISAYDRLVALLARRDHSRLELKEKLTRAGHSPEETAATIAIATERKWLPDESVLALREGQRLARSGKSPRQIYAWLKKKGLPTDGFAADPECKDLELEGALKTATKAWLRLERA
ncbi:MAG: hypothetical protein RBT63_09745, partial [Bdellovibrionales bacterium]|nr:hypothetical protein [Bdellovibrionales bacterium]